MNAKFQVNQILKYIHHDVGGLITDKTPFTVELIKITKVIQPKEPLNEYSEPRYVYESTKHISPIRPFPIFTGNIGEQLLSAYVLDADIIELNTGNELKDNWTN